VYYHVTIFEDTIEVLELHGLDYKLIAAYEKCIGVSNEVTLIIYGELISAENMNVSNVVKEDDLIERFKYLEDTKWFDEYERLLECIQSYPSTER
jgi:type II restriction/modification system DNA methylase subunit YeeA